MHPTRKLGRKPRKHDLRVPRMERLTQGMALAPLPQQVAWTHGMPASLGMMLNNELGDCTCAALAHAVQVWSFNASGREVTIPDADVLALYRGATGYDGTPATDQGGVEQDVLAYAMRTGIVGEPQPNKLLGYVELDVRNLDSIRRAIWNCGLVYVGIDVPGSLMRAGDPPAVWSDVSGGVEGGHAIILTGYDAHAGTFDLVSWGQVYRMTTGFFAHCCDEAYALADPAWIAATGKTPGGLSAADLTAAMAALRG